MTTADMLSTRGRGWAYVGAILGGLISIAANVAHSFVAPAGAATNWAPKPGAVVGSMFWPILLFVAVEILARVKWPKGFWWGVLRFGGMLPVAAVAALVSYRHLRALLLFYGEDSTVAFLGPAAVDGLMVMATAALLATAMSKTTTETTAPNTVEPVPDHATHTPANTHRDSRPVVAPVAVPQHLLSTARYATEDHSYTTGQAIRADELASRINIDVPTAQGLLDEIEAEQRQHRLPVLNGTVIGGERR